jgi:Tol biopolymer transport system component
MVKLKINIIVKCLILILIFLISGCIEENIDNPDFPDRGFFMGILPSPAEDQNFDEVYVQVSEYSEFVPIWSSGVGAEGFWDYKDKLDGLWGEIFLDGYIRGNDMFPLIHFSFIDKNDNDDLILKTNSDLPDATLIDPEWRNLYLNSVLDVVNTVHPLYLSVGNEVNRWYEIYGFDESNENGFQHFVSLYNEIYDSVKQISPKTKVFCVFSREIVDENREADLSVLNLFNPDKLDLLVFTSYPYAISGINKPGDIPIDYYKIAADFIPDKLFGFSELGWSSLDFFGGEKGQADFLYNVSSTLTIEQGVNLHLFGYCWLHDLDENDEAGLIEIDGTEKEGYIAWKSISKDSLWSEQSNEKIVFMSKAESEDGELYLIDKSGDIHRLTNNNRHENNPALSFDGSKVVFHGGDSDNMLSWEIFILDLDTLEETQLTDNNVLDGHPDWSPDGSNIVYASFVDKDGNPSATADIYVIDINGLNKIQLTSSEWEDNDPEWSPDGTKIAFKSTRNTKIPAREEIYIMEYNGSNITRLSTTDGWESDHDPSWSPNSNSLVFMRYSGVRPWTDIANFLIFTRNWDELTPWNTYMVDLYGEVEQLTDTEYIAQLAVFSSDGEKILFIDNEFILLNEKLVGIDHKLTIMNTDGTYPQQLISDNIHNPTMEYFDW